MCYFLPEGTRMKNYELVSKAKIELNLVQQFFTHHTLPLKQDESETTLIPDLPQHTHHTLNNSFS
jgi:hypothetical protein